MPDVTYADKANLIADYLPESTSAAEQDAIGRILESVTTQIDSYCERPHQYFAPAGATATDRIFRGANKPYLQVPVHVGVVEAVSGTEAGQPIAAGSWVDRNGWLYRTSTSFDNPVSPYWRRDTEYTVAAKWGYESTPLDITEACRQMVVHYFERHRGTIGQVNPNGFVIERDLPPPVITILAAYVRKEYEVT